MMGAVTSEQPARSATDRIVLPLGRPTVADDAWVAPGAVLAGAVTVGPQASVWYTAVIRADTETITIGAGTNIQDGTVIHADPGFPTRVGAGVVVGHRVVLHGCTIDDDVLIGMGSVVMNGARIGTGSLVAAGAVVLEGTEIPPGSLVAGVPAKVRRPLTEEERAHIGSGAQAYRELARTHAAAMTVGDG
jgi:carbonic anhydrase/acetyltransferase-like protein (isoleucine patch superfamily)